MKVLVTGADGFLGWHTRVRLVATNDHEVAAVSRRNWADLPRLAKDADLVVHCAGVNRGDDAAVRDGNLALATDVADAVRGSGARPRVVFANSVQADNDNVYGQAKREAAAILSAAVDDVGGRYSDVRLPNLFGEHGRPRYNSFVATFVEAVVTQIEPQVVDREIELLHAQTAAQVMISDDLNGGEVRVAGTPATVLGVYARLREMHAGYAGTGEIPDLSRPLDLPLFNTLRAAMFPQAYPIPINKHDDARGRLVELVRSHGGGQSFLSTTRPGVTRGEHFHLEKVERFVVVSGRARIALRRMLTTEVVDFEVDGSRPVIVDMPTLWAHNITNAGSDTLVTAFWSSSLFDANAPDTFPEPVQSGSP